MRKRVTAVGAVVLVLGAALGIADAATGSKGQTTSRLWIQLGSSNGNLQTSNNDKYRNQSATVMSVAVNPRNGNVVAGTYGDGAFGWNGSQWTQMGAGHGDLQTSHGADPQSQSRFVTSLAVDPKSGETIAGTGDGVFVWRGTKWTALGGHDGYLQTSKRDDNRFASSSVSSVAVNSNNGTIVVGTATSSGYGDGVFEWTGTKWRQLGVTGGYLNTEKSDKNWRGSDVVDSLVVNSSNGDIVAGTMFDGVFEWNGTKWTKLGGRDGYLNTTKSDPNWNGSNDVGAVAIAPKSGKIIAGTGDGVFERNGSKWTQLGGHDGYLNTRKSDPSWKLSGFVGSLAADARTGTIFAGTGGGGGGDGVFQWNGSKWMQLGGTRNPWTQKFSISGRRYFYTPAISGLALDSKNGIILAATGSFAQPGDGVFEWKGFR